MFDELEDTFEPKTGRVGSRGKRTSMRFTDRVYAEIRKMSSRSQSGRKSSFTGRYIGRGYQVVRGTNLSHYSNSELRRVIVKARLQKWRELGSRMSKLIYGICNVMA